MGSHTETSGAVAAFCVSSSMLNETPHIPDLAGRMPNSLQFKNSLIQNPVMLEISPATVAIATLCVTVIDMQFSCCDALLSLCHFFCSNVLRDGCEHAMVRHEAAEALGAIADPECLQLLTDFCQDSDAIVADSCVVRPFS